MYMNSNYNFLTKFELLSALHCKNNSIKIICEAIEKATSTETVRNTIQRGIKSYLDQTKDFKFIATVHNQFEKQSLTKNEKGNSIENSDSQSLHICNRVFDIENLSCKIFSYLDFESSLQCMHVSNQWLYDSLNPLSNCHLNTHDISKHLYLNCKNAFRFCDINRNCDISRFKNITSLRTRCWQDSINGIFAKLKTFSNIKKLWVGVISLESKKSNYTRTVSKVVENNCNSIEKLSLCHQSAKYTPFGLRAGDFSESFRVLFNVNIINLTQLDFNGLRLNFFCVNIKSKYIKFFL